MDHVFTGRREDLRLVTDSRQYTDDHSMDGPARGVFLRSDRAHANIRRLDLVAARALKGVIGILTGDDIDQPV